MSADQGKPCTCSPVLAARASIVRTGRERPGALPLWIPTKLGRAQGGLPSAKRGIAYAAVRTSMNRVAPWEHGQYSLLGTTLGTGATSADRDAHP